MNASTPPSHQAPKLGPGLLRFLESLGQRSEAELYLRIFRELPRDQFALLVPTRAVLRWHAGTLAEQLRFLGDLDLHPTVVLGGLDDVDAEAKAHFFASLAESGLRPREVAPGDFRGEGLGVELKPGEQLIVQLSGSAKESLVDLAGALRVHKTLFLRTTGGLGPHRPEIVEIGPGHMIQNTKAGIGAINLRSDAEELASSELLSSEDAELLRTAEQILQGPTGSRPRATVSVASPLAILRELFTVSGEGTLIKKGAPIETYTSWDQVERARIRELLEQSFGRSVREEIFLRAPSKIHVENDYRGLALVEEGVGAAFLSKFAVLPVARGEGLGQDLWWRLWKSTPAFYWRARSENPINVWYQGACDGLHREGRWTVYWRGVPAQELRRVIEDALARPEDFDD